MLASCRSCVHMAYYVIMLNDLFLPPLQTLYSHPKFPSLLLYDDPTGNSNPGKRSWRYIRRDNDDFVRFCEIVLSYEGTIREVRIY